MRTIQAKFPLRPLNPIYTTAYLTDMSPSRYHTLIFHNRNKLLLHDVFFLPSFLTSLRALVSFKNYFNKVIH
jgi:hypothetical protein